MEPIFTITVAVQSVRQHGNILREVLGMVLNPNVSQLNTKQHRKNASSALTAVLRLVLLPSWKGNRDKMSMDEWFQVITGVTGLNNNWLLMAEQAANMTKKDCVVCMGPRPLLRIIPATIPIYCVVEVMSKNNPNINCSSWDCFSFDYD